MFDLCALNCILGKQNHSATFFDAWTVCRTDHIRNHNKNIHTPQSCKEVNFLSLETLDNFYTRHSIESIPTRATGLHFGNVIASNLLPLRDIFHYIPPLMHIIMGLGKVLFNELKRAAEDLDKKEDNYNSEQHLNLKKEIEELHTKKEQLETVHPNYS